MDMPATGVLCQHFCDALSVGLRILSKLNNLRRCALRTLEPLIVA